MPTDPNDPLAKQNMMDRYHGKADPVAEKYMRKIAGKEGTTRWIGNPLVFPVGAPQLEAPDDRSVKTLYVGGFRAETGITESYLRYA
jgi:pre-mRNA-splicing factor RBM22/SLT11